MIREVLCLGWMVGFVQAESLLDLSDQRVYERTKKVLDEVESAFKEHKLLIPEELGIAKKELKETVIKRENFMDLVKVYSEGRYPWGLIAGINNLGRIMHQHCKKVLPANKQEKCKDFQEVEMKDTPEVVKKNWGNIKLWEELRNG